MQVSVIGCGRWGTFLAWYLDSIHHDVTLYGRSSSSNLTALKQTKKNAYVTLSDTIELTDELDSALKSQYLFISINSQNLEGFMRSISACDLTGKRIVLCMKGLEKSTGRRLSEIAEAFVTPSTRLAVWTGPGHIQDFTKGIPNCMVLDSKDNSLTNELIQMLESPLIRFYVGSDLIGNEIGAAAKNVYGIAAGMLDALGYTSLKGALTVRASVEVSRLVKQLGGNPISVYGLSFLGECETTFFSKFSNNRLYGENYIHHIQSEKLSEGIYTLEALYYLSQTWGVDMPICTALYQVIYENMDAKTAFSDLFLRSVKAEF